MPPPNMELANSIGIGVGIRETPDGATLSYLDQLLGKLREIKNISAGSSISIKNIYQGGPGGGQGQPIGETPAEVRVRKNKGAIQEETRQLSLLDRIEAEAAQRERQRVHETTDYTIGEGRRATGALKASLEYEERLRQQHLNKIKGMTLEQLKMQETLSEGRDAHVTAELERRKGQLGTMTPDPNRRSFVTYDPEEKKWRENVGVSSWEEYYDRTRQSLRGRPDLQQHLPYLEQQIAAHRAGQYTGPLGNIPREGSSGEFELPPEGHPHRGPGRRPGGYLLVGGQRVGDVQYPDYPEGARPPSGRQVPTLAPAAGFGMAEIEEAREVQQNAEEIRTRHRRQREKGAIVDDLREEEIDAETQRVMRRRELNRAINERAGRIETERREAEIAHAQEMARRTRTAEQAATARGYRSPTEQAAFEEENRRAYEERQAAFQRRVREERRRRQQAVEAPYLTPSPRVQSARTEQAEFERLPKDEQDRVIAEQERRWAAEDAARKAARTTRATAGPSPEEQDRGVFRLGTTRPTIESARREVLSVAQAANTLTSQFNKVENAKNASLDMRQRATVARQNLASVHQQAQALYQSLYAPAGQRPPYNQIMQQLGHLQQLLGQARAQAAGLNNQLLNQPGGPGGPGGGGGGGQSLWQRGLFGIGGSGAGGIAATMLTYQAFNLVQRGIVGATTASWEAARAHEEATVRLQAQAKATGRLTEENTKLAESVKATYGISLPGAADIVGGVSRFAERGGVVSRSNELQQALLNIAAGRGVQAQELPTFIELAQNEQGRFAEKYLGKRSEVIFREYAEENRDRLSAGLRDTQASLEKLTGSLTEYEREQALANAVIEKGAEYQGAAAQRAASVVGQLDRTRVMFDDLGASFGRFLQTNRSIVGLLERSLSVVRAIADRGEGLPITGPGGAILSDADIVARGRAAAESGGEAFSQTVDRFTAGVSGAVLVPVLSAGGAIIGAIAAPAGQRGRTSGELALRPIQNYWDIMTGTAATERANEEGVQQALRERHRQIQELQKAGRIEYTGGDVNFGTGQGFRVLSQEDAAKKADEEARKRNDEERQKWADEQKAAEERAAAEREREQQLERVRQALQRIRAIEEQSGDIVGRVAQQRLSENNRYVNTLTGLETVQERMQRQWGSLGDGAVKLFTTLETQSLRVELVTSRFDSLTRAIADQTKAAKERDELELSTALTRDEEAGVRTVEARVNAVRQLTELEARRQKVLGVGPGLLTHSLFAAREQLSGLDALGGPGTGIGYEGRAQKRVINTAVLDILKEFPDAVIRTLPWARSAFSQAIEGQMAEARSAISDALNAESLVAREQGRLRENAQRLADQRDRLMEEAQSEVERRAVGRAFDRALVAQTEGISPRELAQLGLFSYRNEAIMREAQRSLDEETEARRAVMEGLQVQKGILYATALIAASLRSGDMSLLVRVENNARAQIDAEGLRDVGREMVNQNLIGPGAAVQGSKVNPYQGLNDRYGRPGRRE